jgi:hypothetical protein
VSIDTLSMKVWIKLVDTSTNPSPSIEALPTKVSIKLVDKSFIISESPI